MSETESAAATSDQKSGPILVAVDFSKDSEAALAWASNYARLTGATLLVFHVVHDPATSPGFYRRMGEDWLRPMIEVAEEMMAEFLTAMREAHPDLETIQTVGTRLVSGLPAGRIVEAADQVGAPVIVVGSRGRTGLPHILLGSVAERVAQTATVPVVIAKRPPDPTD